MTANVALVLHVLLGFAAIAFLVVPGLFLELAAGTHDVPFMRKAYSLMSFHGRIGGPLAILILPVGIWAAIAYGIPLNTHWLMVSYVAYAVLITIGLGYHMRREIKIGALAAASPDAAPSPELAETIDDRMARPMMIISVLLWIFLIWLMIAHPVLF